MVRDKVVSEGNQSDDDKLMQLGNFSVSSEHISTNPKSKILYPSRNTVQSQINQNHREQGVKGFSKKSDDNTKPVNRIFTESKVSRKITLSFSWKQRVRPRDGVRV